jgi:hypothetical protein
VQLLCSIPAARCLGLISVLVSNLKWRCVKLGRYFQTSAGRITFLHPAISHAQQEVLNPKCTAFSLSFFRHPSHSVVSPQSRIAFFLWLQDFKKRGINESTSQSLSSADVPRLSALENCRDFTIQGGTFNVSSTTVEHPQGSEIFPNPFLMAHS